MKLLSAIIILSCSALLLAEPGAVAEMPALEVRSENFQAEDSDGSRTSGHFEVTTAVTDEANSATLAQTIASEVEKAKENNPNLPIQVVVVDGGNTAAISPISDAAKAAGIEPIAKATGVSVENVPAPLLSRLVQKTLKPFRDIQLYYATQVRPRLPLSPSTAQDSRPASLRMMKVKGILGGAAAGLVLFVFRENIDYSVEYMNKGLTLTALQAAIAMATAYRNNEAMDWLTDEKWIRASGVKDKSAWSGLKRDAKLFGLMFTLLSLSNAESGLLGLKNTTWDPGSAAAAAGFSTVITKHWYAALAEHIPKESPWYARIPVFMYAVANVGNLATVLLGNNNIVSNIAYGTLAATGFHTYYKLKSKAEQISFTQAVKGDAARTALKVMDGIEDTCKLILPRIPLVFP